MTCRVILCVVLGLGLLAAMPDVAVADPISYEEPADLSEYCGTPTDLLTLDVGVNTVSGSMGCWNTQGGYTDVCDAWKAILPEGYEITSVTLAISNLDGFTVDYYIQPEDVDTCHGAESGNGTYDLTGMFTEDDLCSDGTWTFWLEEHPIWRLWHPNCTDTYDYTWTITVAGPEPIPEPGTIVLFGLGLVGLGWRIGRRPKRA